MSYSKWNVRDIASVSFNLLFCIHFCTDCLKELPTHYRFASVCFSHANSPSTQTLQPELLSSPGGLPIIVPICQFLFFILTSQQYLTLVTFLLSSCPSNSLCGSLPTKAYLLGDMTRKTHFKYWCGPVDSKFILLAWIGFNLWTWNMYLQLPVWQSSLEYLRALSRKCPKLNRCLLPSPIWFHQKHFLSQSLGLENLEPFMTYFIPSDTYI